ncbi:hypothetical protein KFE25_008235 [Diacronema lutheri]|uniref:Sorbitol dehydrogenase n=2 Tax=Diacronema lutheri TaxID=2081491 RepID=A0A8J5XDR9_DIALT|nr:hypothetical protein KFE25_008235 [Diacronema lutheri]
MTVRSKRAKPSPAQRALILRAQGEMGIADIATIETVPPDAVRVRIISCGICGSDDHYYRAGRIGNFVVESPMVLGHEVGGVVDEVGADVTHLRVGDKVALEPGIACHACALCASGKYNLCPKMSFFATPPVHGALCTEVVYPARLCFHLPPPLTTEHGALCEPLSVAVYAVETKARVQPGQVVAVFGAGPIGVLVALVAAANGARVITIDMNAKRLDALKALIPNAETLQPCTEAEETAAAVRARAAQVGAAADGGTWEGDVAASIDCTGAEPCLRAGIFAARSGGVLVMVGLGRPEIRLPTVEALTREVDIVGCFRYRGTWPRCIALMASGSIPLDALITHRYAFEDDAVRSAFDACNTGQGLDGRAVFKCMIKLAPEPDDQA